MEWGPRVIRTICRTHTFGKFLTICILRGGAPEEFPVVPASSFNHIKTLLLVVRNLFLFPSPKKHTTNYIHLCFSYPLTQKYIHDPCCWIFEFSTLNSQTKGISDKRISTRIERYQGDIRKEKNRDHQWLEMIQTAYMLTNVQVKLYLNVVSSIFKK